MTKLIELKNINKSYKNGDQTLQVLKDIHLEVEEGEFLAIMGPSGSGKSTLMNIIGLLDRPTSGEYKRKELAEQFLKKVELDTRMHHLPSELSGGQKQRVAIARALVNHPSIILADEPTGALDSKTGEQIMELLTALNQEGKTIIMVTHETEIAAYAKRQIVIRDGVISSDSRNERRA